VLVDEHDIESGLAESFLIPIKTVLIIAGDLLRKRLNTFPGETGLMVSIKKMEALKKVAVIARISGEIKIRTVRFPKGIEIPFVYKLNIEMRCACRDEVGLKIAVVKKGVKVDVKAIILRVPSLVLMGVDDFDGIQIFSEFFIGCDFRSVTIDG
jgi:hypothetical protein